VGNGLADHCSVDHVRSVTFGRSFLVDRGSCLVFGSPHLTDAA
jgi:hypothetical protein